MLIAVLYFLVLVLSSYIIAKSNDSTTKSFGMFLGFVVNIAYGFTMGVLGIIFLAPIINILWLLIPAIAGNVIGYMLGRLDR
ncbi:MAG: hypothetical protein A2320_05805 [Pseudomonadales bacterium GWC2_63_15]|nr:MAG: hypothetical protein A2320_05805 [Pseudomonadales bacterium GWC2_63_15]